MMASPVYADGDAYPENRFAGFWLRVWAFLIDSALVGIASIAIACLAQEELLQS
jgi:uncharacterized RDD family membrane protein YckC